jgi:hypothetical protein
VKQEINVNPNIQTLLNIMFLHVTSVLLNNLYLVLRK